MKKRLSIITIILCVVISGTACSSQDKNAPHYPNITVENQSMLDFLRPTAYNNTKGLELEPGAYISIIGRYSGDSYWEQVEAGAEQAIDELNESLGYKGDDEITISFCAPDRVDDVNEQVNILDEELARYPVAVAISPIDPTACHVQFEMAADNNISIITFDSGTNFADIISHIATDNKKASADVADNLASLMKNQGEVAIFAQDSRSTTAIDRIDGFTETIKSKYENITIVNTYHLNDYEAYAKKIADERNALLAEGENQVDPSSISHKEVIQYIIESNPNLKAIYTTNLDTTQLLASVLKSMEKDDLIFVGFDGGDSQTKLLSNGMVDGLIVQNPYAMGYAAVVAIVRNSMELGNEAHVDCGYTWVTKDNMKDSNIKNFLY